MFPTGGFASLFLDVRGGGGWNRKNLANLDKSVFVRAFPSRFPGPISKSHPTQYPHCVILHHPLQKLIKELPSIPSLVPDGAASEQRQDVNIGTTTNAVVAPGKGHHRTDQVSGSKVVGGNDSGSDASGGGAAPGAASSTRQGDLLNQAASEVRTMGRSPGEVAFFKLLHSELWKAEHFFGKAQEEFAIREERVREGMEIMKKPNSIMVNDKWSLLAKSLYHLYKDLLLLETYAIMAYCSFSKILKKHDKNTGYDTRNAFMSNLVNRANFTHYPKVLKMISSCEAMYEEVSAHLAREGQEGLGEDERLFINMIHRLNAQVIDTAEAEGGPAGHLNDRKENLEGKKLSAVAISPSKDNRGEAKRQSELRSLVEDNDARKDAKAAIGTEQEGAVKAGKGEKKRSAIEAVGASERKRKYTRRRE